jgi:hypothetical protein
MAKSKFSPEELELIDQKVNDESIPYDYKTKDYSFEVLNRKFGEENNPEATLFVPTYQRQFIWEPERQSKFIESVLLGVPLTPFLVSEDILGRLEIIDGSQRIRTLIAFYNNELRLRALDKLSSINKAKFKDLPKRLQRSFENRDFKVIVVNQKADISIRQDIFGRINTSSKQLTDSELRKGAYAGPFYDLILNLKDHSRFREICPISADRATRGEYEELILRFFTYCDNYLLFKHDVGSFLNSYLDDMNDTQFDSQAYEAKFDRMVSFVGSYFPLGFKKEPNNLSVPRVRFEAISVGTHLALEQNPTLVPSNMDWVSSPEFAEQTTSDASNNKDRLKNRVEFVRDCLLGVRR